MSKKLDALLLAQLREFRNTQSTIQNGEIRNLLLSIVFLITIILAGMLKGISRLYPVSFFALGHRWKEAWKKNKESRKFWVVTVILGLVINILGGVILAIFNLSP
ncbi:MAG: hypothetical protein GWN00_08140 [Aliifodinibius sp.]|nr:hypothetical protein [Fodinibius sp.]NIY24778.1 hypothetical protein [Fodinibius sp.]